MGCGFQFLGIGFVAVYFLKVMCRTGSLFSMINGRWKIVSEILVENSGDMVVSAKYNILVVYRSLRIYSAIL